MLLFHDIEEFPKPQNGCVVTIGKFDGVHLGHQLIFDQLKSQAAESDLASLVINTSLTQKKFLQSIA